MLSFYFAAGEGELCCLVRPSCRLLCLSSIAPLALLASRWTDAGRRSLSCPSCATAPGTLPGAEVRSGSHTIQCSLASTLAISLSLFLSPFPSPSFSITSSPSSRRSRPRCVQCLPQLDWPPFAARCVRWRHHHHPAPLRTLQKACRASPADRFGSLQS